MMVGDDVRITNVATTIEYRNQEKCFLPLNLYLIYML